MLCIDANARSICCFVDGIKCGNGQLQPTCEHCGNKGCGGKDCGLLSEDNGATYTCVRKGNEIYTLF